MSGLGLSLSDNVHVKGSSSELVGFSFPIGAYKKYKVPVCGRGVRLSLFWSCFVGEESCGFHKEFSSPTCLWVVQLNKHFHGERQDICLEQDEGKIKPLGHCRFAVLSRKAQEGQTPRLGAGPEPSAPARTLLIHCFEPFSPFLQCKKRQR